MAERTQKPFAAYNGSEPFVFVSYTHEDKLEVYRDINRLHQDGHRIWYDEGITPGEEFLPAILKAIRNCSYLIAFISRNALISDYVKREMGFARKLQKQIIPIHLEATNLTDEFEFYYGGTLAIHKCDLSEDDYLKMLEKALISVKIIEDSVEKDFDSEVEFRIKIKRGWSNSLADELLKTAEFLGLDAETAKKILSQTLTRLGINEEYETKVDKFRQLVDHFLESGEISPVRRRILTNRAKDLGIPPIHWETIIQEEAVSRAKQLKRQDEIELARAILVSSVGQHVEQSKEIRLFLEQLEAKREIPPPPTIELPEVKQEETAVRLPPVHSDTAPPPAPAAVPSVASRSTTAIGENVSITWVHIPAGLFLRGCPEEFIRRIESKYPQLRTGVYRTYPVRKEPLDEFWISQTPITNAQYHAFVKETGHRYSAGWRGTTPPYQSADAHKPVTGVTWFDSVDFVNWLGARLPARAEYEKACRGEDGFLYPWGNEFGTHRCNSDEGGVGQLTPVDNFPQGASPYGVLDLVGNVWEWADDGEERSKMTVGGSFQSTGEIFGVGFFDMSRAAESSENDLGFRVACCDVRKLLVKKLEFEYKHPVEKGNVTGDYPGQAKERG